MIHFTSVWCAERARKIMEPPMASTPQMVARIKLLNILPRKALEDMLSNNERPHMKTKRELVIIAATSRWNLSEVHNEIERIFRRADPEGTQP